MTQLMTAVDALLPEIRARGDEIEANRFLPQDIADRLAAAGLHRMCGPKAYRGLERGPLEYVDVVERIATADGSAAWCVFIGATAQMSFVSLEPDVAAEFLTADDVIASGVFAPAGRAVPETRDGVGGYRVNGRWGWGSGMRNASVLSAGALVTDADGAVDHQRILYLRTADITILDTWHVTGLRGTGSNDFEAKDLFVPARHTAPATLASPSDAPIARFPRFGFLGIGIAAVALGLARSAIDDLVGLAGAKTPQGATRPLALRGSTQTAVAEAEADLRAARAFFREMIADAWAEAQTGEVSLERRRDLRLATSHAVKRAVGVVDAMFAVAGGSSVYESFRLQRTFRDVHVAAQHMMVAPPTWELAGKLLLGVEARTEQL